MQAGERVPDGVLGDLRLESLDGPGLLRHSRGHPGQLVLAAALVEALRGVVLGLAVLLDAFLVRLVLLPVLLRLTGRAAWYTPAWMRKVLPNITFAHD